MKNLSKLLLTATLMLSIGSTIASADATKGQKLYTKKLKSVCGISGAVLSGKHTQDEWSEIGVAGLKKEIQTICPKATDKLLKDKYLPHYLDFFHEYGSDSGNVPSC
jgi:hypothetical protein